VDDPFPEAAFAKAQVVLPHPDEDVIAPEVTDLFDGMPEIHPPMPEGLRVIRGDVFHADELHVGLCGHLVRNHSIRWQLAAGEDVALDEIDIAHGLLEPLVRDGDGLISIRPSSFSSRLQVAKYVS